MTEAKSPISLSTMLGDGDDFEAKDKAYTVKPIALKHIDEFMKDNLSLGTQMFTISNPESKAKIEKWMNGYCFDEKGEPMSIEKAMADDWDIVDLKNFIKRLCDLSG
jgi:hypothetical protein